MKNSLKKDTQKNAQTAVPRWNLDSIYPSLESPEYKKALEDYKKGMDELDSLFDSAKKLYAEGSENFDFALWLSTYLPLADRVGALEESLAAYAYLIYSVDTTSKKCLDNMALIDELGLRSQKQELTFRSILKKNISKLPEFYKRFPQFAECEFILNETLDSISHQMSDEEENLASDLQRTGGDAWSRLHEQLISNLKDDETGKTFNELRNDAYSPDSNVRKSSYLKELSLLKANRIAFAAALNNLKGETVTLNKRRNWTNAIDRSLMDARMSRKTLDALIEAIEDSLPFWRKYMQFKAELLYRTDKNCNQTESKNQNRTAGCNDSAAQKFGLSFYDLFAPLPLENSAASNEAADKQTVHSKNIESLLQKTWTFQEAKDYILKEYYSFSKEMGDFAKNAFEKNWIDAEVRSGKVGGAYCQDFPAQGESRVLSNFNGAFSDIITLAHELGHAYHHYCIKGNPYSLSSYPMTLAETASTFAETIVKQDLLNSSSGNEKISLLEFDLQDACQILVDILCRYYFESAVFEKRTKGELTADDFCELMKEAQEKSYGDGLNENRHEYMWAVKSHYYSTGLDFYNFPYAFGQLFALGLYARYKKEGAGFANVYSFLLSDTGKMNCEDLCKKAGFDITDKEFWKSGILIYQKEFEQMKNLLKN